jgi:hypothetical protein
MIRSSKESYFNRIMVNFDTLLHIDISEFLGIYQEQYQFYLLP